MSSSPRCAGVLTSLQKDGAQVFVLTREDPTMSTEALEAEREAAQMVQDAGWSFDSSALVLTQLQPSP